MLLAVVAAAPSSAAAAGGGLSITFVARECPTYEDISANRARNNLEENLRNLGENTAYPVAGEAMNPIIEAEHQPHCTPLPHWKFTLGTGIIAHAVAGPWGALSIITGQLREPVETLNETALLDAQGQPTGKSIPGAVTIELGKHETELASRVDALWVQGGTPEDPIMNKTFPGQYGFGALRCAIDDLNGDNVEWVGYPQGTRHVFCFAYYVKPPPTAGTIIIRKKITSPAGAEETFDFAGDVSYNPGGLFKLSIGPPRTEAEEQFIRAETAVGEQPWNVHEIVPAHWTLTAIECSSKNGTSKTTTDLASAEASITLGAEDVVTCVYNDEFVPPESELTIRKVSIGDTGTFGYKVTTVSSPSKVVTAGTLTTTLEGLAVETNPLKLPPGEYFISETQASKTRGTWTPTAVGCSNGKTYTPGAPVRVKIEATKGVVCTFTNTLKPTASLRIQKRTEGGVGRFGFSIVSENRPLERIAQDAQVNHEGTDVDATGQASNALFFEPYVVQEVDPPPTSHGHWDLVAVRCDGRDVPFSAGRAIVAITEAHSKPICLFTNKLVRSPEPPLPPEERAIVTISKRAAQPVIKLGQRATFTIVVTNHGPVTAREVAVDDQPESGSTFVSVTPSQGTCTHKLPLHCELGSIAKGGHATIRVVLIPHHSGTFVNRTVVGIGNPDPFFSGASAHAKVLVRTRRRPRPFVPFRVPSFTG